jgi:hypothetical protein
MVLLFRLRVVTQIPNDPVLVRMLFRGPGYLRLASELGITITFSVCQVTFLSLILGRNNGGFSHVRSQETAPVGADQG